MPELNLNLLAPSAQLYSGPKVELDPVKAYETAQTQQQNNMLAQLYAKHYDPQTGGVNYNNLIGDMANSGLGKYIPETVTKAQAYEQSKANLEKTAAETKSASAEANVREQTSLEKKISNARTAYESIYIPTDAELQTPEGQEAYKNAFNSFLNLHEDIHSDPDFQKMYSAQGGDKNAAYKQIMSTYGNPNAFRQLLMTAQMGTKATLDALDAQAGRAETERAHRASEKTDEANVNLRRREIELKEAENKRDQATFDLEQSTAGKLGITPKAFKEREAQYPAATAANESANNMIDMQIADLEALKNHPSLPAITGPYDSRTKGVQFLEGTKEAQALFDKVYSGQTLQGLVDLRRSSPSGAGVGSASDKDMLLFGKSSGLDQNQYASSLKKQIDSNIEKLKNAKKVMNNQYNTTYSYKSGGTTPTPPTGGGAKTPPADTTSKKYADADVDAALKKYLKKP